MSLTRVGPGIFETTWLPRADAGIGWPRRLAMPICLVLIFGSFAIAGALQLALARAQALSQARESGDLRASQVAAGLSQTLGRYGAIADAFSGSYKSAETSAALAASGGAALRDVAVLDTNGRVRSEMTGPRIHLLPLSAFVIGQARHRKIAIASGNGLTLVLLLPRPGAILSVQLDSTRVLAPAVAADGVLATPSGRLLVLGSDWREIPPAGALALTGANALSRMVRDGDGPRLVSLARVEGWPLVVGTSVPVAQVLKFWSGSLPLYLFIIIGPAIAGGAMASLFAPALQRPVGKAETAKRPQAAATAEARMLVRLAHAERRARDSEEAKSRFVSLVSHELRTPLNAIIGFAEAIESGVFGAPGHPKYSEYARDIGCAGRELHAKIGAILEYAALGKKADPDVPQVAAESDAVAVAKFQVESRRSTALERGVRLEAILPDQARVRVDAETLGRILAHLLDNAIAYTSKSGSVRAEVCASPRETVVIVQDTGSGFTRAERELAGKPFQRFARPGSRGGMGVGLAIAMGLANRIGATLTLASLPGEGTRAELRVPPLG